MTTEPAIRLTSAEDARRFVEEGGHAHVKVGVFDIDGILRGKYMSPRQVLLGAREGLRLLRRGPRLGFQRPALRQRQLHRLAHGLSGRAGAHPARHLPRDAVRGRHAVLPRASSPARPRRSARAGCCGACSSKAAGHGLRGPRRRSNTSSSCSTRRRDSVREKGYRNLKPHDAGLLRLLGAALARSMPSSTASCSRPAATMDMALEGLHTETGPGRARGRDRRRRGAARRRQGGAVQDVHQGARAAPRPDGDVHGEVVAGLAGPERPHPPLAARTSDRQAGLPRRLGRARHERRRCATSSAGSRSCMPRAAGDGGPDGQLLFAADPRLLGADLARPGASRTAPPRCA